MFLRKKKNDKKHAKKVILKPKSSLIHLESKIGTFMSSTEKLNFPERLRQIKIKIQKIVIFEVINVRTN